MGNNLIDILPLVRKPVQYINNEVNAVQKDLDAVRLKFALAFPDMYEVGMSHLGIQILYSILNSNPQVACERVFTPGIDLEKIMRERGDTLSSLESSLPLREFDVIGFSLQYELCYTNVLTILDLAGIPLFSAKRDGTYPLIMGGGPMALNPEPVADFFDAFLLGDGEDAIGEITDLLIEGKDKGWKRDEVLERLSGISGVYVPSLFNITYHADGSVNEITPLLSGYKTVEKRILKDLESAHYPVKPVVPYLETVHDRLSIEIARGCTKGCRFCQAGYVYRPIRERSPDTIVRLVRETLKNTGYDDVSLLSLSTGDYSCIQGLIHEMMDMLSREKTALSFPSLRVGTVSPLFFEQVKRVRKTGLTLAPEAGTPRLRKVINKEMDETYLKEIAKRAFEEGWKAVKLYFMIGLPTERDEDLMAIVDLAREVLHSSGSDKTTVKVNVSTFVPKAHTPFQWLPQISLEETVRKQNFIKGKLKRRLHFKGHDPLMSLLEGVFSRGDRRLGRVIQKAFSMGCRLDGWKEHFDFDRWKEAFKASGLNIDFYVRRDRENAECLPWNHLRSGVSEDFLVNEYNKAVAHDLSEDCRVGKCELCDVCDFKSIKNRVFKAVERRRSGFYSHTPSKMREFTKHHKVRVRFSKRGAMKFLGHLDLVTLFSRALRRAHIPFSFSNGFHPLPKITFGEALPVGLESLDEYVDIELERFLPAHILLRGLERTLPDGIKPLGVESIPGNSPPIATIIKGGQYVVSLDSLPFTDSGIVRVISSNTADTINCNHGGIAHMINEFIDREEVALVRKKGKSETTLNIRPFVRSLSLLDGKEIVMTLEKIGEKIVRPSEVMQRLLGLSAAEVKLLRIVKTETVFRTSRVGYQAVAMGSKSV
jgi:radical SAM family uncharacterized protein/radical SAM-linked protein